MSASWSRTIPELRPWALRLLDVATRAGVAPRVTSTFRSHATQTALYRQFLAGKAPYPVAIPGSSAHEYGYAFDLALASDGSNLQDLGSVWESWGGVYGGRFGDPVHFEYPGFKSSPTYAVAHATCKPLTRGLAATVDALLGFLPVIGEAQLIAWIVSLGYPQSEILQYINNPLSKTICG